MLKALGALEWKFWLRIHRTPTTKTILKFSKVYRLLVAAVLLVAGVLLVANVQH